MTQTITNRTAAMFLALIAWQLALVAANPFHKYPYVFLLDVGNEELEKTNTEQIRLSVPGGSLALRYPAVGSGDTIAHIRVSGIDFGTDLKANIVDGGPGYKYVVLVFVGNQGVPYDAVMTVQTVSDEVITNNQKGDVSSYYKPPEDNNDSAEITDDDSKSVVESSDDENVSSEDTNDDLNSRLSENTNEEWTQQSEHVYSYANRAIDYDTGADNTPIEKDIHSQYRENQEVQVIGSSEDGDENNSDDTSQEAEPSHFNDDYGNEENGQDNQSENENINRNDGNEYEKYQPLMPLLRVYDGVRFYPQNGVPFAIPVKDNSVYSPEDQLQLDQTENNYNDRIDDDNRDSNNNYFEPNDESAVES